MCCLAVCVRFPYIVVCVVVAFLLSVVCWALWGVDNLLFVVRCELSVVRCASFVAC